MTHVEAKEQIDKRILDSSDVEVFLQNQDPEGCATGQLYTQQVNQHHYHTAPYPPASSAKRIETQARMVKAFPYL